MNGTSDEHRENIRKANRRRASHICQACHNSSVTVRDGRDVGGLPGVNYRQCSGCGWTMAITHRPRKGF